MFKYAQSRAREAFVGEGSKRMCLVNDKNQLDIAIGLSSRISVGHRMVGYMTDELSRS